MTKTNTLFRELLKERSPRIATFQTFDQSDEKTRPDPEKDNDKEKDKDNDNDNDKDNDNDNDNDNDPSLWRAPGLFDK